MESELSKEILFVDIANIAGRDRLIFYEQGNFSWFDTEKMVTRDLLSFSFNYTGKLKDRIPWVNMNFDLNNDTFDDFIIPGFDGFSILIQNHDGTISNPVKLGPPEPYLDSIAPEDSRTYQQVGLNALTIPWYLSRVHFYDHNLDGQNDLIFWNIDHFDVHYQTEAGQIETNAVSFNTDVPTGTDGPYSLAFQFSGKGGLALILGLRKSSTHTYLQGISDINDDGITDMVTHTLSGRSPLKMKSRYNIYFGTKSAVGTQFKQENHAAIYPSGKAGLGETAGYSSYWFTDFNNDNKKDLFRYDVRMGIGSIIRTLLFKTVYIEYEYFQNEYDMFPEKPNMKGLLKTKFDWDAGFYPTIKIADINGDGKMEVIVTKNPEEIHFFTWNNEQNMLSNEPIIVSSKAPNSELNTWLIDINDDQKKDIFMYHPSESEPHHLVILIAQ